MPKTGDLRVETERFAMGTVVRLIGDAALSCITLELALMRLSAERPSLVVIDLSRCDMISSLAIGMIVGFNKGMKLHNGQIRLASPTAQVKESLRFAGLCTILPIFDNTVSALA